MVSPTSTTLSVDAAAAAALQAANALPFEISIDGEELLVTAVSGGDLTVERGYGNTQAAAHAAGAAVVAALDLDPVATTIVVTDAAALQAAAGQPNNFVVQIDSEQLLVTAVDDAGDLLTVQRGYNSTTAATHAGGAVVLVGSGITPLPVPLLTSLNDPTTIALGSAAAAAALAATNPLPFVIQVDSEQMLVTSISGNMLTVQRGYNNTPVADHLAVAAGPRRELAGRRRVRRRASPSPTPWPWPPATLLPFVIEVDAEQMNVTAITGNTLTVTRGYNGTTAAVHSAGATVALAPPPLPPPPGYQLDLAYSAGTYQATLSSGNGSVVLGLAAIKMTGVTEVELQGGPGGDLLAVDPSVTLPAMLMGGGNDTLDGGSGANTLVIGPGGSSTVAGGSGNNTLVVQGGDNGGTINLAQSGSMVAVSGNLTATATNITAVSVFGGAGNDDLNAAAMSTIPVTLDGAAAVIDSGQIWHDLSAAAVLGSGTDTLTGSATDVALDSLYVRYRTTASDGTTYAVPGPADFSASTVTLSPATVPLGGTATATLTARDVYGNPQFGGGLRVAFSSSLGTFGPVADHGDGTYTATFTATRRESPASRPRLAVRRWPAPDGHRARRGGPDGGHQQRPPVLRNYAVGWVTISFSEPVRGFTLADLVLQLNHVAVPLTDPNITLVTADNQNWTLGNLALSTCTREIICSSSPRPRLRELRTRRATNSLPATA